MSRTSANILIGILGVMLLYGVAVLAGSSIKPVTTTEATITTAFVRTTIPRSQDVQVKDTTTTTLVHTLPITTTTVSISIYPYQKLCEFAASHGTAGQFIENVFVWGFDNTMGLERDEYYEETSQALFDIMDRKQLCINIWGQFIIESSRPFMFDQEEGEGEEPQL